MRLSDELEFGGVVDGESFGSGGDGEGSSSGLEFDFDVDGEVPSAFSYTHLTLPTILLV